MKRKTSREFSKMLEKEIKSLTVEIKTKENKLHNLQHMVEDIRKFKSYKNTVAKYDAISEKYEKEKERLVKLHQLYKHMEVEHNTLKNEVQEWRNWFNAHSDLLEKLFSSAPQKTIEKSASASTTKSSKRTKKKKVKRQRKKAVRAKRKLSTVRA